MKAIRGGSINIPRTTTCAQVLRGQRHDFTVASRLRRTQGYGDAEGDPIAEHAEKQQETSEVQESLEHPGPPPPDVGKGTANAPTKAANVKKLPEEDASAQSGGSRSKEAVETGRSPTGGEIPNSEQGNLNQGRGEEAPQPKIHNESVSKAKSGQTEKEKRDVEKHNRAFRQTHGEAKPDPQDKVGKGFWSGTISLTFQE
ncbi:hypothetical protein F4861DRAFT_540506 [Xylaria intraflava]|nr:hypothetical protein F4861DRAFT_540506 [Xylaria intraflava]